ncbi:hypothetical protein KQI88_01395 [Alkaliphilus sp. MSJ-5]|uniref:ABC transporter permease n=1 Tax=Alkaliphilus flagellatus TaxID=2841507 RepID=A0ABS6FYW1_9FIRM|nr:ABC transporter permease subunit [Alkaliphilus flagellatus]MBU5675071.1 hypothetical protein [Alkaliphilus flagellatus]
MITLINYELTKLFCRRSTKILLIASFLLCLILLVGSLLTFQIIDSDMNIRKGMSAIEYDRTTQKQFAGEYTNMEAKALLAEIEAVCNNPQYRRTENQPANNPSPLTDQAYYKYLKKYDPIWTIINYQQAFPELIAKVERGDLFQIYQHNAKSLDDMKDIPDPDLNNPVAQKLTVMYKNVEIPFHIDYIEGWNKLIYGFSHILALLISAIVIICLAPIFSDEYSTGAAAILLTTKHGKNKLIKAKVAAAFTFSTSVFFIFALLYTAFYGLTYGFSGATSSLQTSADFIISPYNLTMVGLFLRVLGIGYLGLMFLTAITLFISSKSRNAYTALIPLAAILFLPLIDLSRISKVLHKILLLFPIHVMRVSEIYPMANFYNIFGLLVDQVLMAIIVSILLIFMFVPFSYRAFKSYQVQG